MLAKGIQLTIMIGPVVPIPVPQMVMDALDSVQVTTAAGSASGFQMSLQFSSKSELNTFFIIASVPPPPQTAILSVGLIFLTNSLKPAKSVLWLNIFFS